jgi:hypothetical protein
MIFVFLYLTDFKLFQNNAFVIIPLYSKRGGGHSPTGYFPLFVFAFTFVAAVIAASAPQSAVV